MYETPWGYYPHGVCIVFCKRNDVKMARKELDRWNRLIEGNRDLISALESIDRHSKMTDQLLKQMYQDDIEWKRQQRIKHPERVMHEIEMKCPGEAMDSLRKLKSHLWHCEPENQIKLMDRLLELPTSQWPRAIEYMCHKFDELKNR